MEVCEGLEKKMKQFNIITSLVNIDLVTPTVTARGVSTAVFVRGVDLFFGITLSGISLTFSHAKVITQNSFITFTIKQGKHFVISRLLKVVKQHSRYHFTGNARRRHLIPL